MGTYGSYEGTCIQKNTEKRNELEAALSKILNYGGMMKLKDVSLYGKKIYLLEPVTITEGKDVHFTFNYFEETFWEDAGYIYNDCEIYSNKIGVAEFNDVITAARVLFEIYDEGIGYATVNGDVIYNLKYVAWINNILGTQYSIEKRYRIWDFVEKIITDWDDNGKSAKIRFLPDILPDSRWKYLDEYELAEILYIFQAYNRLLEKRFDVGCYLTLFLQCKELVKELINNEGKEDGYNQVIEVLKMPINERKSKTYEKPIVQELNNLSLNISARIIMFFATKETERDFWSEWMREKDSFYSDEIHKHFVPESVSEYRKKARTRPILPIHTSDFLRQSNPYFFMNTPKEIADRPNYYLTDEDRLYWWDGTDEVIITDKTQLWLDGIKIWFETIKETIIDKKSEIEFTKDLIMILDDIRKKYNMLFAFQDMFYEFIENSSKAEYLAAVELLRQLSDKNEDDARIIQNVNNWSTASKNVKCIKGRMEIKRYLSLLANRQLRKKYLEF